MPMFRFFKAFLSGTSHAPHRRFELKPSSKANIYRFFSITPSERRIFNIYKNIKTSVVTITPRDPKSDKNFLKTCRSIGSGVVWDLEGHIVTNYHVIQPIAAIPLNYMHLDVHVLNSEGVEEKYIAKIVGTSSANDLAVLKITTAAHSILNPIMVEESGIVEIGQDCFIIGAPHAYRHSLVSGRISGINRMYQFKGCPPMKGMIQVDASPNPGICGAPVLNYSGHMIGIHCAGISYGIAMCIPSSIVVKTITDLIKFDKV